ncbi:hypothetical protein LTR84_012957 [Exophiala bonariae]|uniref:Uncharacterized protein n=1 Tax=Exophiala bonariae TaxID=1690606 RepID=A0AAV9NH81_9EURO|nr:hypothetical protein LTR84_012957 [Exophiala bonariae]
MSFSSTTQKPSRAEIRAEIKEAKEDGWEMIDVAALKHEIRTKAMIEDLYRGMEPFTACMKYNIGLGEMVKRIANYARHQGKQNGEFR